MLRGEEQPVMFFLGVEVTQIIALCKFAGLYVMRTLYFLFSKGHSVAEGVFGKCC